MPFTVPVDKRILRSKAECLELWTEESARFKRLFNGLSPQQLATTVKSSSCGHTFGQHIPCMVGWMVAAHEYFKARKDGTMKPFGDEGLDSELDFTNRLIQKHSDPKLAVVWRNLEVVEREFMELVNSFPIEDLFLNKDDPAWNRFIWSTFGHYAEHSDELEWQLGGRPGLAPDRSYGFKL